MKTDELSLTIEELDELCRLYMDCKLSVLEEKELEYVLSRTPLTSPAIKEVRSLVGIRTLKLTQSKPKSAKRNWNWRLFSGIAASIAILISVAIYFVSPQENMHSNNGTTVYVAAYSHGQRLNERDAITSTDIAMAKADSLIQYATLTERHYMMRANDIISETSQN